MPRPVLMFVLSATILAGSTAALLAQCPANCPERRTVSVNATGIVTADADLAIVHVGYKLYGMDAKSAYASASETSNAIMTALTAAGVPKASIESSSQLLQHTQPYELQQIPMGSEDRFKRQFTVSQSWMVRTKPDDAAKTLNTAINAGANESGWIQWVLQDEAALQAQAAAKAVANARTIAEQMVAKSDVHLGHLVSVTQNQNPFSYGNGSGIGGMVGGLAAVPQNSTQPLAINSRRVELRSTIYAVYSIE